MKRREFTSSFGLAIAGVTPSIALSGCTGIDAGGGETEGGPEHADWLYRPDSPKDGWYGYMVTHPSEMPEGHRLKEPYDRFGIETDLKFYRADYESRGMMGETDRTGLDVVKYSEGTDILEASPEKRIEETEIARLIRAERPASTGGPLTEQEVIERVGGFDIYERGAAINDEENVLICGIQEYVRQDVIPDVIEAYTESERYRDEDLTTVWEVLDKGEYNEFGVNPGKIPGNDEDYQPDAFGTSQKVTEDGVEIRHAEVYRDDNEPPEEFSADREGFERDGDVVVYTGRAKEIATAYDHRHTSQGSEPL